MSKTDQQWQRLVVLARKAPGTHDDTSPHGFSTRVVALATANTSSRGSWAVMERLALRGVVVAATCCLAAVAFNYFGTAPDVSYDSYLDEPVSVMLDLS